MVLQRFILPSEFNIWMEYINYYVYSKTFKVIHWVLIKRIWSLVLSLYIQRSSRLLLV